VLSRRVNVHLTRLIAREDYIKLISSSFLRLGLPSILFPTGFSTENLYAFHLHHTCYCPVHLIIPHLITLLIFSEAYKLRSSLLCTFLRLPITFSVLGPNIFLGT